MLGLRQNPERAAHMVSAVTCDNATLLSSLSWESWAQRHWSWNIGDRAVMHTTGCPWISAYTRYASLNAPSTDLGHRRGCWSLGPKARRFWGPGARRAPLP